MKGDRRDALPLALRAALEDQLALLASLAAEAPLGPAQARRLEALQGWVGRRLRGVGPWEGLAAFWKRPTAQSARATAVVFAHALPEISSPQALAVPFIQVSPRHERLRELISARALVFPWKIALQNPDRLLECQPGLERWVCFDAPHPGLWKTLATASGLERTTVYLACTDWTEAARAGRAPWWDEGFERHLLRSVDRVLAPTEPLLQRARALAGSDLDVELLPAPGDDGDEPLLKALFEALCRRGR